MVFSDSDRGPDGLAYAPLTTKSSYVSWNVNSGSVTMTAGSNRGVSFFRVFPAGIPQPLDFPSPGCWRLQVAQAGAVGYVTVWVRP